MSLWKKFNSSLITNISNAHIKNYKSTNDIYNTKKAIFDCLENANDSQPYVPEMKSLKMGDLLTAMAEKYLPEGGELKVKTIGLQPGENMHEKVLSDWLSSNETEKFTIEEIKELI